MAELEFGGNGLKWLSLVNTSATPFKDQSVRLGLRNGSESSAAEWNEQFDGRYNTYRDVTHIKKE